MFSETDLRQIKDRGMCVEVIERQINHFVRGFPFIRLAKPAIDGDGILSLSEEDKKAFVDDYDRSIETQRIVKFVPASGAASRMFKHLYEFRESYVAGLTGEDLFNTDKGFNSVWYFITHIREIAFFNELSLRLERNGFSFEDLIKTHNYNTIIDHILTDEGLDYSNLPKGLIRFHDYNEGARTPAEEHMVEAALYARNSSRIARLHFTISPEHRSRFEKLTGEVKAFYESRLNTDFDISFSIQQPSTDTIAVDEENQPFRNPDNSLLFRPGGHGSLMQNLNDIEADIIFIKNIDNIIPDRLKDSTVFYKKLIGGYLIWVKQNVFEFLQKVEDKKCSAQDITNIIEFGKNYLCLSVPEKFSLMNREEQIKWLFNCMNRPMRVCGMVKNNGEPGGGPYWVRDKTGQPSLQIVESSQVDVKDPHQLDIFRSATHFNPVDLVCAIRDYKGNKFDLSRYVEEETGFISVKSSGGRKLKALERPGLWNGAMADWITVFIEVPIITFNPVKTVNDLLRKEHLKA